MTYSYDGILYRRRSNYMAAIGFANKNDTRTHLVFPERITVTHQDGTVQDFTVREIDTEAFRGSLNLREVVLSPQIEYVGQFAFTGCLKLVKVLSQKSTIHRHILREAFRDCVALQEVRLETPLDTVSQSAFENCFALKVFDAPIGLASKNSFKGCKELPRICLDDNAQLFNNSIEESGIQHLFFRGKTLPIPVGLSKWIKKHNVQLICMSDNSTICELAYNGFNVCVI